MKETMKSYHMFLPRTWVKWFLYLLYPVFAIGGLYALCYKITFLSLLCTAFAGGIVVGVEYMLDGFVFAGIASKHTNRLEYLKTSIKGMPVLKRALIADGVRRFCSITVIMLALCPMICKEKELSGRQVLLHMIAYILFVDLLLEAGFIVSRFFTNVMVIFVCIYLEWIIVLIAGFNIFWVPVRIWQVVLLAAGCIAVVVAGRKLILKRARDSYYDNRMEKMHEAG